MNQVYKKAYTEILEIIKYLPIEEYRRIPKEKIEYYNKYKDPLYKFNYNPDKSLNEQNVLRQTKVLIVDLFREVVATEEQKEKLDKILIMNEQNHQNKLQEKFNYDELFKKRQTSNITENEKEKHKNNTDMIVYKENIFVKVYNFFKRLLNKK